MEIIHIDVVYLYERKEVNASMKKVSPNRHMRSRFFAPAMALMLFFGICCPAASASAESFLYTHKDEIVDAIVAVRSNLESLGDDLAAIQEAVEARTAELKVDELIRADGGDASEGGLPLDFSLVEIGGIDVHDLTLDIDSSHFSNNTILLGKTGTTNTPMTSAWSGITTTAPKTGDLNNIVLWIVIVAVSALALAAALFFLLRKKKKK